MSGAENYRTTQAVMVIIIFCLFGVAFLNVNWFITVGAVLAAAGLALYASTTQPASSHNDHHH